MDNAKLPALGACNLPIDDGVKRSRRQWERWGEKRLTEHEKALGFVCVVAQFDGYFRVNWAAQPSVLRVKLNGRVVR